MLCHDFDADATAADNILRPKCLRRQRHFDSAIYYAFSTILAYAALAVAILLSFIAVVLLLRYAAERFRCATFYAFCATRPALFDICCRSGHAALVASACHCLRRLRHMIDSSPPPPPHFRLMV